jgi:hypothetical protein
LRKGIERCKKGDNKNELFHGLWFKLELKNTICGVIFSVQHRFL